MGRNNARSRAHRVAQAALEVARIETIYVETGKSVGATAAGRELEAAVSEYLFYHAERGGRRTTPRKELIP